ncbi:MAG: ABC transporter substrate-binding protein [Deltaproteobacteria bacterium]|nr:ABC transporter substrate-binding protein [Deltaproteobacteria bacterium]
MRRRSIILLVLAVAVSCTARTRRTPDDTLVVLIEQQMTSADPRYALSGYDAKLNKLVNSGLTVVDSATLRPELALAESMVRVDDLTWDVTVRADAKFSDGTRVTAADVAGTYADLLREDSDSLFHKGMAERFHRVEARDERTARFHLKSPLATFVTDIDYSIVSYGKGVPEHGKTIGAGPYVIREITSQHVVLDVNPHYVLGQKPRVPVVEIKFVRDVAARLLMLAGGSADLVQNALRYDLIEEVRGRDRVKIDAAPSVFLTYLLMNNTDPALRDLRVRQAIALALDRPAIIAAKFGGFAVPATGLLPPTHWAYNPDVPRWDRDLERARRLLDEAGFPDPDGAGPEPRLRLVYKTSSDHFRVSVARVIAAQLAEVGIEVEVRAFEFATFFADVKKGTYQLASMQTAEITEPDFYFTYFHSSWIPSAKNPDGYNRWRYINPDVDRLTEQGRREVDPAKRKTIYAEAQRLVARDLPIVPLWHEDNVVLSNVDVEGYTITPNARLIGLRDAWKR